MNILQIEENVIELSKNITWEFLFDLLLAYGIPKSTITLIKNGKGNISKTSNQVILKKKVFFHGIGIGEDLHDVIYSLNKEKDTHRHNPRFLIVTDYKTLVAIDTKTQTTLDCKLSDLWQYYDFFLPWAGMEKSEYKKENPADVKASYKLARLYDAIREENSFETSQELHSLNKFLSRILFCFFAEDTGIFPKDIFTKSLDDYTQNDGWDVSEFLQRLFQVLDTKSEERKNIPEFLNKFPYVNGALFREVFQVPKFNAKSRKILVEAWKLLTWSEINPDIFGSMVQAVVHPDQRENMWMHYTSVPNIMKVIEPLFLDELKQELENNKNNPKKLQDLLIRISKIKVFDPACGSWNFLIIAYKELRRLEIKILDVLYKNKIQTLPVSHIQLSQFYGIEIDDFACEVANLSLYIAKHQMNLEFSTVFGIGEKMLPLEHSWNITHGNATRLDWEVVCPKDEESEIYLLGNPPYLGSKLQDKIQKEDMKIVFWIIEWYKILDYITPWFYKGAQYIKASDNKMAFVTTNSICQWEQVSIIWPIIFSLGLEINFTYNSFKWTNNAKNNAGVSVVIIWINKINRDTKKIFFDKNVLKVQNINAYLVDGNNTIIYKRIKPISILPTMSFGNMPNDWGGLILTEKEKEYLLEENINNSLFIKELIWANELIKWIKRYCLWINDSDLQTALHSKFICDRIQITKNHRINSKDVGTNELSRKSHQFRDRNITKKSSIIIPSVSSERREYIPCSFIDSNIIAANSLQVIYDCEPWVFGIINSKIHLLWVLAVWWKLESRIRYSKNICYNTFPFPEISEKKKQLITEHVYNILDEREKYPEKTLAQLYDPDKMPKWLKQAHEFLDEVIERCYRATPFKSDEERLSYLFKMYEEMIEAEKNKS